MKFFEWLSSLLKQFFSYFENIQTPKLPSAPKPPKTGKADLSELSKLTEGTLEWYRKAFELCRIDEGFEAVVRASANLVLKGKARYKAVEKVTGVPWYILGCLHYKEASCSFAGVLHNGEHIIGTGKKTSIVPIGRGPFSSWEEAAIDAITINNGRWAKIKSGNLEIGEILYACERFNGLGYITGAGKAETSPYLWARSNINDDFGKYVRDGVFDPNATTNKTTGVAVILMELERLGEIEIRRA